NWNRTGYIGDGSSGNTDLYFQAEEGNLRLGDSSSHSVLILSGGNATFSGNVGIGTASPTHKLNVVGNQNLTGNLTLGDKITFAFGQFIDNLVDGWLRITGNLNVTGNITSENVFIPQYIFSHTDRTQPVVGANVWTNITFDQEATAIKFGISHTHNDDTNNTFTINEPGVYRLDYDFDAIDASPSASDIDMAGRVIFTNGTEIAGSAFEIDITKQQIETEISHSFLAILNIGDEFIFQFIADNANVAVSTHGTFGSHPDSATIIIEKVANL
ncbi:hypothetical protein LCGC14_1570090, partial [marine sediment metagenome]